MKSVVVVNPFISDASATAYSCQREAKGKRSEKVGRPITPDEAQDCLAIVGYAYTTGSDGDASPRGIMAKEKLVGCQ